MVRHKLFPFLLTLSLCVGALAGFTDEREQSADSKLQLWLDRLVLNRCMANDKSQALVPDNPITYPSELGTKSIRLQVTQPATGRETDTVKLKRGKSVMIPELFHAFKKVDDTTLVPLSLQGLQLVARQGHTTASRELKGIRHHIQVTRVEREPAGQLLFKAWENRLSFATPIRCEGYNSTVGEVRFLVGTNSMALQIEAYDERFGSDHTTWPETVAAELYVSPVDSTNINQVILCPGAKEAHKRVTVVSNHKTVGKHSFFYAARPLQGRKGYRMIAVVSLGSLGLKSDTRAFDFEAALNVQARGWEKPGFVTLFHSDRAYESDEHYARITVSRFIDKPVAFER